MRYLCLVIVDMLEAISLVTHLLGCHLSVLVISPRLLKSQHSNWESGYRKFPKYSDTQKICCNHSKIWTMWLYHRVMSPNDADGMANSVDPDQTAPLGTVWSGSALFAQANLSENLGSLRYIWFVCLFCGLTSQSPTMVMSRRPVNQTTFFVGSLRPKQLTGT